MPVFRLGRAHVFPDPELADASGLLAVGGDLDPARVLLAYRSGIFPWYSRGEPILWWSPDPRMVLPVHALHVPRSLAKRARRGDYRLTMDTAFAEVIAQCGALPRPGQKGTWITADMKRTFVRLHELGHAHSVEAWEGEALVGGLYGLAVGRLFCGESMFTLRPDASKVAFVALVEQLRAWDVPLIDCQVHTEHLARFGAHEVPRTQFLAAAAALVGAPGRVGRWSFDGATVAG
jgi:leucyl/phenylalanyl-tRNA--protein transferase